MGNRCNDLLSYILLIGLFSYLNTGEEYEEMVLFTENHYDFVKEYSQLPKGISSHHNLDNEMKNTHTNDWKYRLQHHKF